MEPLSIKPEPVPPAGGGDGQPLVHPEPAGQRVNLAIWFVSFALWLIGLAVLARLDLAFDAGATGYRVRLLLCLLIYMSLACTFLPLPTSPVVAWAATANILLTDKLPHWIAGPLIHVLGAVPVAGGLPLAEGVGARTLLIAGIGALGTLMANLNDYHLWTLVLRQRKMASIRDTRLYRAAVRWFSKSAWFTLVGFTFIPIPIDVIRLLAITFRYPRWRFASANYVGRFFRYGILAWMVAALDTQPAAQWWLVIGVTVLTVGAALTYAAAKAVRMVRR